MSSYSINNIVATPPPGSIIAYFGTSDPFGWVICDGTLRSNADGRYNNLLTLSIGIGTVGGNYTPPDLRAMFLRGIGTNAASGLTTYSGPAAVKTSQLDAFKSHSHTFTHTGVSRGSSASYTVNDIQTSGGTNSVITTASGDTETRPVNIGVNWMLKL